MLPARTRAASHPLTARAIPPDFSAAKQESCLNVSLYSLLFGVSFSNRIWSGLQSQALYFFVFSLQFALSGGFVSGPVIILSLNVFRPHYADARDDDDWAHMCVKSVPLFLPPLPLLRRVQLPFPVGAAEAADACGRHFH